MPGYLMISAMGFDRPGIVEQLSNAVLKYDANVEESRMARLGGEFAVIMLVSAPAKNMTPLSAHLKQMSSDSLLIVTRATKMKGAGVFEGYALYELSVGGADHEGIIQSVARFLTSQGINIAELQSDVDNAPVTGTRLFSMRALIQVLPDLHAPGLRSSLVELGKELGVDIEMRVSR